MGGHPSCVGGVSDAESHLYFSTFGVRDASHSPLQAPQNEKVNALIFCAVLLVVIGILP